MGWREQRLQSALDDADPERKCGTVAVSKMKKTLASMANMIVKNPEERKFRIVPGRAPALKKLILAVDGGKRCLVGLGFAHVEEKDVYVCKLTPEELGPLVQVLRGEYEATEGGAAAAGGKGGDGRSFLSTQASADHGFKSFPDGLPGLQQRWAELEMCLREGWDLEVKENEVEGEVKAKESKVALLREKLDGAGKFFASLDEVAAEADVLRGAVFNAVSTGGGNRMAEENAHGISKLPDEVRKRVLKSLDSDAQRKMALQRGSAAVLSLLRLKIVDDADLDTARQAVSGGNEFVQVLEEYAAKEARAVDDVLLSL